MDLKLVIRALLWDPVLGRLEHDALLIQNGRIEQIGQSDQMLAAFKSQAHVIDARQGLVMPGFNDAHTHLFDGGFYLLSVDLRQARDEQDFQHILHTFDQQHPHETWITGGHWDHESWPSRQWPSRQLIDRVVPDKPVFLVRLDWHIGVANSLALGLAGIDKETIDPVGGSIQRDPHTGEPTGILCDTAMKLVQRIIPPPQVRERIQAVETASQYAAKLGITSMQGPLDDIEFQILFEAMEKGSLHFRFNAWQHFEDEKKRPSLPQRLISGGIKIFSDGSLGAGTALMFDPYPGKEGFAGLQIHSQSELNEMVETVDDRNQQLIIHAIGDRAVHMVLTALERKRQNGSLAPRHRLEHVQVCRKKDFTRFRNLKAIASVQPSHCIDDMRWLDQRIGGRTVDAHPIKSLLDAGVDVAFGTDWSVESLDPRLTLYAAVTREYPTGGPEGGWMPQEKITLAKALFLYTWGSAYAERCEHFKGRLLPGYVADIVGWDANLFDIEVHDILRARIQFTIFNGELIHYAN
jgi:hypothetical protein